MRQRQARRSAAGITKRMRIWIVSSRLSNFSRDRPSQMRIVSTARECLARGRLLVTWNMDSLARVWWAYGSDGLRYRVNGSPSGHGSRRIRSHGATGRLVVAGCMTVQASQSTTIQIARPAARPCPDERRQHQDERGEQKHAIHSFHLAHRPRAGRPPCLARRHPQPDPSRPVVRRRAYRARLNSRSIFTALSLWKRSRS
jgi:hypothetical protein